LVVGAENSSNSNRLREIGVQMGIPSYLIDDASKVRPEWLDGVETVGITAGASAPEELVQGLIDLLGTYGDVSVEKIQGAVENMQFKLPRELERADNTMNSL
ncbi:MAG: 4-hydroxy-3-methylbut-2-enyl diphosphate reductase, partial [Rhodospirillales bacterium]|nr:4-hydroxy-3-methylbut-2-enyl diphosphate reductase [Rhodospirillales bacterium]